MPDQPAARPATAWRVTVAFSLCLAALVGLIVLAFVWPSATAAPHRIPIAIAGTADQIADIEDAITDPGGDFVDIHIVSDRTAAVASIERRESDAAIIAGEGTEVLVSAAGGPTLRSFLDTVAHRIQTEDTANPIPGDRQPVMISILNSTGNPAALTAASLPIVLGGIIGGVLISIRIVGPSRRLAALISYAIGSGVIVTAILQPWLGALTGPFHLEALAIALAMLGTASLIVGLTTLLGPRGILIGAAITMLIANPLAGVSVPTSFITYPWGTVGQLFVPGAALTLIRELSFLPLADHTGQWLVLTGWAAAGAALGIITARWKNRQRQFVHAPLNSTLQRPS